MPRHDGLAGAASRTSLRPVLSEGALHDARSGAGRSRLPLRGSPGIAPGSLLAKDAN